MKRTAEELGNLVSYEKMAAFRVLEPPRLTKDQIADFILCQNYEKAKRKIAQSMERYDRKIESIKEDIAREEAIITQANRNTGYCDTTSAQSVARHNDWIERGRKAIDKRNDLIDKHNEALEEARERLDELTRDALVAIDDDIVAVLDKCTRIVEKLAGSENSEDLMVAIETCLMELRIFHFFEEHIEGNAARKDCRDRIAQVNQTFVALCNSDHVRNYLSDLFRRNGYLVEKNTEVYGQLVKLLGTVNQGELDRPTHAIATILGEPVETSITYDGVIDPAELDKIVEKMREAVRSLQQGVTKARELSASTKAVGDAAAKTQRDAEVLMASMKSNVDGMSKDVLFRGHFACEMVEETVIDDFFHKDLRPSTTALRQHLIAAIGEEQLDTLVMASDDRYCLRKAEAAIKQARLFRLQAEREKIDGHIERLTALIAGYESAIAQAGEVPQRNVDVFRSGLWSKHSLSALPVIGIAIAFGILGQVKAFEAAFRSTNPAYRDLATEVLARTRTMTLVVFVLSVLAGLPGIAVALAPNILKVPSDMVPVVGVASGALVLLYLSTGVVLAGVGKRVKA